MSSRRAYMPGFQRLLRRIDQAKVHHRPRIACDLLFDLVEVAFESFFQPSELAPVGLKPKPRQAYA